MSTQLQHPSQQLIDTQAGYNLWSKTYDEKISATVQTARAALVAMKPDLAGKSILEIGCGTGANLILLNGAGLIKATGLDLSSGMLREAGKKQYDFETTFIQHDVRHPLPLAPSSVDLVLISLVLEHLSSLPALYREITRVLKPCGEVVTVELHPFQALNAKFATFTDNGDSYGMQSIAHSVTDIIGAQIKSELAIREVREFNSKGRALPIILGVRSAVG